MKQLRLFIGLTFTALVMSACHSNEFKLEGAAEGMKDGDTILIFKNAPAPVDTLIVKAGEFEWSGQADSVVCYFLTAPKTGASTLFFAEPGTIHINLYANGVAEVSGTTANDALQEMNVKQTEFRRKVDTLLSKLNNQDTNEEQQKAIYDQYNALQEEMNKSAVEIAIKNLDNELGYMLISGMAYGDVFKKDELKEYIAKMPAEFQKRQAIKDILKMLEATFSTEEGDVIPDFTMQTPEGKDISIISEIKNNKITVIDFWASWCGPCREEMPAMKKMLTENKDKGFGIVGISLDDNKEDWAACIQELQLTWPQMSDLKGGASTIAQSFGVRAIPFTVVVSQDGTILKKGLRGEELAAFVSEKLK